MVIAGGRARWGCVDCCLIQRPRVIRHLHHQQKCFDERDRSRVVDCNRDVVPEVLLSCLLGAIRVEIERKCVLGIGVCCQKQRKSEEYISSALYETNPTSQDMSAAIVLLAEGTTFGGRRKRSTPRNLCDTAHGSRLVTRNGHVTDASAVKNEANSNHRRVNTLGTNRHYYHHQQNGLKKKTRTPDEDAIQ